MENNRMEQMVVDGSCHFGSHIFVAGHHDEFRIYHCAYDVSLFLVFVFVITIFSAPKWMNLSIFAAAIYLLLYTVLHNLSSNERYTVYAKGIQRLSQKIEPYSMVLPVNCSTDKHMAHIKAYVGAERAMVLMDNLEANLNFFPCAGMRRRFLSRALEPWIR